MPTQQQQMFLGSTPVNFYYLGDTQMGLNPASISNIPSYGLIYAFDATNPISYPGSGSVWYDISPNAVWAAPFSSSTFPTYNSTNKEFNFNGTANSLMVPMTSSIATGSKIVDFTQIVWVKLPGTQGGDARGVVNLQFGNSTTIYFDSITFNDDANVWRLASDNNNRNVTSAQVESVFNTYYMITATRTAGTNNFKILKDGPNVIATGSYTPQAYTSGSTTGSYNYSAIGNRFYNTTGPSWAPDGFMSGSISAVMLYNRVLTDAEIQQIYAVGRTGIQL